MRNGPNARRNRIYSPGRRKRKLSPHREDISSHRRNEKNRFDFISPHDDDDVLDPSLLIKLARLHPPHDDPQEHIRAINFKLHHPTNHRHQFEKTKTIIHNSDPSRIPKEAKPVTRHGMQNSFCARRNDFLCMTFHFPLLLFEYVVAHGHDGTALGRSAD